MIYADTWVLYDMLRNGRYSVDGLILGVDAHVSHSSGLLGVFMH